MSSARLRRSRLSHVIVEVAGVAAVQLGPDGRLLTVGGHDDLVRLWTLPSPVEARPEWMQLWVESLTGTDLDPGGAIRALAPEALQSRRRQLDGLGWTLP